LAPVAKILNDEFGIERGWMTTIHAYTSDQRIQDMPHKDLRRARAAAMSMIPTTTGAAKAVGLVLPELQGKLDGAAIRVPTPNVSVVDLIASLAADADPERVNQAFREAAAGPLQGILHVSEEPLVSIDFNGSSFSSVVDAQFTNVVDGKLVQILSWYDNEMGYSTRLKDLAEYVAKSL
jgi:glyceraldehyde 3-phosphate dehydrogenase